MKKRGNFFLNKKILIFLLTFIAIIIFIFVISNSIYRTIFSGKATLNLTLFNEQFKKNSLIAGEIGILLEEGDLIPVSSIAKFILEKPDCNYWYVCDDGTLISWQKYDISRRRCVDNKKNWTNGPWELCAEKRYQEFNCDDFITNEENSLSCCESGGFGDKFGNLRCSNGGGCWSSCKKILTKDLQELINLSTTPTKGNISFGTFRIRNNIIPGEGAGYAACSEESRRGGGIGGGASGRVITGRYTPSCMDTDGGQDIYVSGNCSDAPQVFYKDYCLDELTLNEYYCSSDGILCLSKPFSCLYGCNEGKCNERPVLPSYCTDGTPYNSCSLSKPFYCSSNGNLIPKCTQCGCPQNYTCDTLSNKCVQEIRNNESGGGGVNCIENWTCSSWNPEICPKNKTQTRTCVDVNNCGTTNEKPNEIRNCTYLEPENSCIDWNNLYSIELSRLNILTTPNEPGIYNLTISLEYNETEILSASSLFSIKEEETDMIDIEEERNSELLQEGNRTNCRENWVCGNWTRCDEETNTQTRTCRDINQCNPINITYENRRLCCIENWVPSWGGCKGGFREKTYIDLNNCGTTFNKPPGERESCIEELPFTSTSLKNKHNFIVTTFLILITIILTIMLITKRRDVLNKKDKVEKALYNETLLESYIKRAYYLGIPGERIKKKLVEEGNWPEDIVDEAIKKVESDFRESK
ncbi:MAG: hypothetical protein QXU40_00495 [Candidatus Pacearchaeota archaeon]